jgi:hypothetical protein
MLRHQITMYTSSCNFPMHMGFRYLAWYLLKPHTHTCNSFTTNLDELSRRVWQPTLAVSICTVKKKTTSSQHKVPLALSGKKKTNLLSTMRVIAKQSRVPQAATRRLWNINQKTRHACSSSSESTGAAAGSQITRTCHHCICAYLKVQVSNKNRCIEGWKNSPDLTLIWLVKKNLRNDKQQQYCECSLDADMNFTLNALNNYVQSSIPA